MIPPCFEQPNKEKSNNRGDEMYNKNRKKNNPFIFTISALGVGAAAYYLTKEAMQSQDLDEVDNPAPSDIIRILQAGKIKNL